MLKLRNIPTKLEAITEKFGESGTHTFTRDSLEDALNDRDWIKIKLMRILTDLLFAPFYQAVIILSENVDKSFDRKSWF